MTRDQPVMLEAAPAGSHARRKLLFYTHALAGGGAERVCALLASGFARRGAEVVLAVDYEAADNLPFLDPRVRVVVLGGGHAMAAMRLARLLRHEKPDASVSAIGVSNVKHSVAALLAGRMGRAILTYHAFAVSEPQRLSQLAYWGLPLFSRSAGRVVAVSRALQADLERSWHAAPGKTVTIHNPVVVGGDAAATGAGEAEIPLVLAAGRLAPGKNMIGLVRAFALVARSTEARLVILGEGTDRPALEAEVAALGLTDRVSLPGYVAEPWTLYREAACFATASRMESFSMVVAEALSFGLPVVAVDSPGPREVLADGAFGTLVPPGDDAALAAAILRALAEPVDAERLRARARVFSLDAALDSYERLVQAVGRRDPVHARQPVRPAPTRDMG